MPLFRFHEIVKIEKKQHHLNFKVFLCDQCLGKIKKKTSKTLLFLKAAVEMWCVTCVLLSIFDSITYNEAEGRYDAIGQAGISNPKRWIKCGTYVHQTGIEITL